MATEEPQTNLAQTIASNLEAVIEPAAVLAVAVAPGEPVVRAELAELAAQGVPEVLVALAVQVVPAVQVAPVARGVPAVLVVPENPAVRAALVIVQAEEVPELETGPGGAELELRTVLVAEPVLEVVQAEEPVPNQPHGHLAAPEKTKSVTALRRHDLAAVLMAEDLAVAEAETMHGQAAAEAVTAWEAAVTVVVVAVVDTVA